MDTKKLRQKILDLAIHGKLVPQDPNDEPASVLLERIKAEKERLIKEGKIKRSKKSAKTSDTPHYENVPFEVPEGWCITDIGELLINRDGERKPVSLAIRSKQKNKVYDYYGAAGVIDKVDNYLFDECLLLIGEDGANLLSRNKNNAFLADGKYWVNNHAHVLDTIDKFILSYVAIVINSMKLDDYITGSAQPKLSQDNLNKIPIFLPPLNEQKRIMTELERWFALIDQIDQGKVDLQETIKQTKSKILDLAIHGKLVPQDPNDEPAIELLTRINPDFTPCDNGQYGKIPQGWILAKLGDLFDAVSAKRVLKSEWRTKGVPFYRAREIVKLSEYNKVNNELFIEDKHYDKLKNRYGVPASGDIMLSAVGTIGKCYIVKESDKFYYKDASVLCLKNHHKLSSMYFSMLFSSSFIEEQIKEYSKGTTVDTITLEKLKSYIVPLPPLAEQQRIVQKIEELFSVLDNIQNALEV
mgnify:FL=1